MFSDRRATIIFGVVVLMIEQKLKRTFIDNLYVHFINYYKSSDHH